jgi:hypothetical protein
LINSFDPSRKSRKTSREWPTAQNTSTNVGEAQTATEHLSQMATELRDLVGQFKLGSANPTNHHHPIAPAVKVARQAAGAR